jgi:hypothetical protein
MDAKKKKCFVVMGFGEKTDLATGRTLDLDKTYRNIIRKAVEEAGLECIRADDVIHAGLIDKPMYQLLLEADIVIADLSTANANAIYELGVRHALRPHMTIVIAEKQFKFPFDLSHLLIRPYEHLGKGIDSEEADRMRGELKSAIEQLLANPEVDSPVYEFLPHLREWTAAVAPIVEAETGAQASEPAVAPSPAASDNTATELMDMFREAKADSNWSAAANCLKRLLARRPNDAYVKQQLALATYKSQKPDAVTALNAAKSILQDLDPHSGTDPETLGLWGAVHKRLYEETNDPAHLDEAIWAHEKGFYVRNDYYNGINLAFVLDLRASISHGREANADVVLAERIRRRIIESCRPLLAAGIKDDEGNPDPYETFWVGASLVEALAGSGEMQQAAELKAKVAATAPEEWMVDSMEEQLRKLAKLLGAARTASGRFDVADLKALR